MMLSQKIKEYRALKGWTQDDLAKFSGVSLPSIKRYEMGNDNITTTNLKKIASALDVNIINFMSPNMSPNTQKNVSQSVDQSRKMSPNMSTNPDNLKVSQEHNQIHIIKLSSNVGAGESVEINGVEIYDTDVLVPFSQMLFKTRITHPDRLRCMRVDGYSMAPMLYPDSWVVADVTAKFEGDGLYIIDLSGNFMVKLLQLAPDGTLEIISVNKDYKSYEIHKDDNIEVRIIGKVLRCVI